MAVLSVGRSGRWVAGLAVVVVAGSLSAGLMRGGADTIVCNGVSKTVEQLATERGVPLDKLDRLKSIRDVGAEELCSMPKRKLDRALFKIDHPNPDHPGEAVAWRNLRLKDEKGQIPMDGALKALEHVAAMPEPAASADGTVGPAQISRTSWTWIGPGNIGGRIRSMAFHPTNASTIWIGSVGGGLWKTTNAGTSWTPVGNFLANMAISSIVINATNPQVMYVGTGEGVYNGDAIRGAGVLKSTDGGVTWSRLAATANANFQYVNRLAISPNGATVLAATRAGLFRSTDGGTTWSSRLGSNEVLDTRWNPADNTKAIAGGRGGQAWYSTDSGATWKAASGIPAFTDGFGGRVELSYAASSPSTVYASVDASNYNTGSYGSALYRSTDGGKTYSLRTNSYNYLSQQGWYADALWVSPKNPNLVVVGGLDLWRSTDGGSSFTQISQWWSAPTSSAHADHHVIVAPPNFDGSTVKTVYFGNDGGVYKATNISTVAKTSGWTELNNNLGITQFYGIAGNPTTLDILGGAQDNGTQYYSPSSGKQAWKDTFGGDGGFVAADPTDPNYWYGEYVYLTIHRATTAGGNASYIYSGISDANGCANFIAPFILDPNQPKRMLAGGCSLWRSNNVKATNPAWSAIKSPYVDAGSNTQPISAIAVAPGNSNIVWVAHNDGSVFKTTNATAASPTWTSVGSGLPGRYVNRLTIADTTGNTVYASLGGYSAGNVWRTTNGGTSWAARSGTGSSALPSAPVYSLVIHPNNVNTLYVGTDVGVFFSTDAGSTWNKPSAGPAAVSTDELIFLGTKLYAGTHGRGVYWSKTQ